MVSRKGHIIKCRVFAGCWVASRVRAGQAENGSGDWVRHECHSRAAHCSPKHCCWSASQVTDSEVPPAMCSSECSAFHAYFSTAHAPDYTLFQEPCSHRHALPAHSQQARGQEGLRAVRGTSNIQKASHGGFKFQEM